MSLSSFIFLPHHHVGRFGWFKSHNQWGNIFPHWPRCCQLYSLLVTINSRQMWTQYKPTARYHSHHEAPWFSRKCLAPGQPLGCRWSIFENKPVKTILYGIFFFFPWTQWQLFPTKQTKALKSMYLINQMISTHVSQFRRRMKPVIVCHLSSIGRNTKLFKMLQPLCHIFRLWQNIGRNMKKRH